jgi:dihydroorotate dehydrogenase electron transfer subunit
LNLIGPLGRGYRLPKENREVILIGGGLGVAPLPLLAEALQTRGISFEAMLGARTAAELWGQEELQHRSGKIHLADESSNVYLATDDGSAGHRGFVTELLEARLRKNFPKKSHTQIYACGPMPMLQRVAAICKKAEVPAQIAVETVMGCGFGICMGCPVEPANGAAQYGRYLLACMDGPVFQADEIRYGSFAH